MSTLSSTLSDGRDDLLDVIARLKERYAEEDGWRSDELRDVLEKLSSSVLELFRQDEWPRFCQLNEAFERNCGLPVPSLSICGHGTAEIRFTKLLSWFFDSRNPHGLGGLLAESVFREFFPQDLPLPSFAQCISQAEVGLGATSLGTATSYNSLDIMVHVDGWRICIEQKVHSSEGTLQLKRYSEALTRGSGPDKLIRLYLTPDRRAASDDNWIPISHQDVLLKMAEVLQRRVLYPTARHNLKTLLWDLMLGPVAQDERWIHRFRSHVSHVAKHPDRYYAEFSRWLNRYGIDHEGRKMLLNLVEV